MKFYYKDGTSSKRNYFKTLHRIGGPAVELANGHKEWWVNGKRHRIDGPAVEYANRDKYWYVEGVSYSKEAFDKLIVEVKQLPKALKLIDSREWVRNFKP